MRTIDHFIAGGTGSVTGVAEGPPNGSKNPKGSRACRRWLGSTTPTRSAGRTSNVPAVRARALARNRRRL